MENEKQQSVGQTKKCPKCGEEIQVSAKKCKHCQADLRNWFVRHKIMTGILALVVIVILINVGGGDKEEKILIKSNNSDVVEKVGNIKEEEIIPEPELIELSGTSQQATQKFTLENGLSIFKMTHTGTSNFAINLMDSNGQNVELLVNEIGNFDGTKAVGVAKRGEYILDVSANGKWTVKIEQPRPTTSESKPETFTGTGQQASPFIKLDKGLTTFKLNHTGKSNFAVVLMDKNGNSEGLLVNEIGAFNGSKAVGIDKSGIYILDVSADGNWTISIE